MVVYKGKLIKVEPVYGEAEGQIIEMWATFEVEGHKIEVFLDNFYVIPKKDLLERAEKHFNLNLVLMTYNIHRINIEEKILKQISTFPKDPLYFVMGDVTRILGKRYEEIEGKKRLRVRIEIDCGIRLETETGAWGVERLKEGDYVAIIGKMFGEIVRK